MDPEMQKFVESLESMEATAEDLLRARRELLECDKLRNGNREALTAMRKQARTSRSSLLTASEGDVDGEKCLTCGNLDPSSPTWIKCSGTDLFIRMPFHQTHCKLYGEQVDLEMNVKQLQSRVKETALSLSEKGAIADTVSPSLVKSFVTLKDTKYKYPS